MTSRTIRLFQIALRLPESERAELAERLIASLDEPFEESVEAAWGLEIQKRLEEIRTGQVKSIPWPEARRLILDNTDDN